jgi:hypothetical protein
VTPVYAYLVIQYLALYRVEKARAATARRKQRYPIRSRAGCQREAAGPGERAREVGVVLNTSIGSLAHLGLGRAYALEARSEAVSPVVAGECRSRKGEQGRGRDAHGTAGETPALQRALAAYQDFFALWKHADPDIRILKQANAEYVKLK